MSHTYYSQRTGTNPNLNGLPLKDTIALFLRVFAQMEEDGYFHEAFGFWCVDAGHIKGRIPDKRTLANRQYGLALHRR